MLKKQDSQGVRTASQLEQKWKFGESFAKAFNLAKDAQDAAMKAQEQFTEGMTQEAIFNALTNNGKNQGLYRGEDGELYINASYIKSGELIADLIKSGVLQSVDGKTKFNLASGFITCTDGFGQVIEVGDGMVSLIDEATGYVLLRLYNLGFGGGITFHSGETGKIVGSMMASGDSLVTSFKKQVLFSGNIASGVNFTVPNTANYDLFAVKLGDSSTTEDTVVLAYKNGNTINGVGGWAGTASLSKELFFVSATFDGTTWTLVDARKQGIYSSGNITSATALNVKEVVGVI